MPFVIIAVCILYLILQFVQRQHIYRPSVMLAVLWGIIILLCQFRAFRLPAVNALTYTIILCGLVAFFIGSALAKASNQRLTTGQHQFFSREINTVVYGILTLLFFAVMLILLIRSMSFLLGGATLYEIRYSLQEEILGDGIVAILFNYFCIPYLTFMVVYAVSNLFSAHRKAANLVYAIIGIVFITVISGGRFFILYFAGSLFIAMLMYRNKIRKNNVFAGNRIVHRVRILIIVAISAIILVSIIRGSSVGKTIYVYLCGGVPFMEHLNDTFVTGGNTYGAATLYGFLRPVFVILRKLGLCGLPSWLQNVESIFLAVDNPYYLAPGLLFNSFSTAFFAPYLDGGFIGVCIVFILMGFISESIYKRTDLDNEYVVSWFLLIALIVLLSFFRLLITNYSFALSFVYLRITHKYVLKKNTAE